MKDAREIMQEMLQHLPDNIDKREGSLIYTALAPLSEMLAEQQWYTDNIMDTTMPDTARGDDLTRKCAESGVNRYLASRAVRKGVFVGADNTPADISTGTRFGAQGITYVVETPMDVAGEYRLLCQEAGVIGNSYFGALLPIDNVPDLSTATLAEVLVAGEDEETDDQLRDRYYKTINAQPFGGNIAQYKAQIMQIDGVGDVRVFPTPGGQGGRVHCVIVAPGNEPASQTLIDGIQAQIDPEPHGCGYGIAPIGHAVTVSTVAKRPISVSASVVLIRCYSLATVKQEIQSAIEQYFQDIAFEESVVRISRVEAAALSVAGVADMLNTKIAGSSSNLTLSDTWDNVEIPQLSAMTLTEA